MHDDGQCDAQRSLADWQWHSCTEVTMKVKEQLKARIEDPNTATLQNLVQLYG